MKKQCIAGLLVTGFVIAQGDSSVQAQEIEEMNLLDLLELNVVSASKEEESIEDAPSPVSVITQRMIEQSGAKTLREILTLYVPGMTFVQDQNEANIAMRGVFGSANQKVLIMLDGHRLNNRAYAAAPPDFGISLEKVKQIEVLRGPGSSLYGNVALTAVVNLVTLSGAEMDGGSVTAGLGSFGERKFSGTFGKAFDDFDLAMWGAVYTAKGERVSIPDSKDYSVVKSGNAEAIVGGYSDTPSYDVGMKLKSDNLTFFASTRSVKYTEPFTAGGSPTGQSYDYDSYRTLLGVGPGMRFDFTHLGLTYDRDLTENFSISLNPYADHSDMYVHLVIDPAVDKSAAPSWSEYDMGAIVQGKLKYQGMGKGTLTVGAQLEYMKLYDSFFPIQVQGEADGMPTETDWGAWGDNRNKKVLAPGSEKTYAGFVQVRHQVNDKVLLNIGGRYDVKDRRLGKNVSDFSPRMAAVYKPMDMFSVKASYARSFVDAPYWYRNNSLGSYRGGVDLKPEHLTSYQLTSNLKLLRGHLRYSLNLFYNELEDFIWRNNAAAPEEPIYQNAGFLKSYGAENEVAYVHKSFEVRSNFTYQAASSAKNYGVKGKTIFNIPKLTGSLILDVMPIPELERNVSANIGVRYLSSQTSPISGGVADDANYKIGQIVLMDVGVTVKDLGWNGWKMQGNIYNLTNNEYEHGGSVQHPYPQNSRWFSLAATHDF